MRIERVRGRGPWTPVPGPTGVRRAQRAPDDAREEDDAGATRDEAARAGDAAPAPHPGARLDVRA